jgi:hypothetical protein
MTPVLFQMYSRSPTSLVKRGSAVKAVLCCKIYLGSGVKALLNIMLYYVKLQLCKTAD